MPEVAFKLPTPEIESEALDHSAKHILSFKERKVDFLNI